MVPPDRPAWLAHELVQSEGGKSTRDIGSNSHDLQLPENATTQSYRSKEQERRRVAHLSHPLSGWMRWRHTGRNNSKRETNKERETERTPPFQPRRLRQGLPSPGRAWKPRSTKLEARRERERGRERDYTFPALRLTQVLPGHPLADPKR